MLIKIYIIYQTKLILIKKYIQINIDNKLFEIDDLRFQNIINKISNTFFTKFYRCCCYKQQFISKNLFYKHLLYYYKNIIEYKRAIINKKFDKF